MRAFILKRTRPPSYFIVFGLTRRRGAQQSGASWAGDLSGRGGGGEEEKDGGGRGEEEKDGGGGGEKAVQIL